MYKVLHQMSGNELRLCSAFSTRKLVKTKHDNIKPKFIKEREFLEAVYMTKHDEIKVKLCEESALLEAKYQTMYEPLYSQRFNIVSGVVGVDEVTKEVEADKAVSNTVMAEIKDSSSNSDYRALHGQHDDACASSTPDVRKRVEAFLERHAYARLCIDNILMYVKVAHQMLGTELRLCLIFRYVNAFFHLA
ncbi:hypothetical protein C5167_023564 [Papaver somniferum]|uniref:Uncharacterized protein n=1 Tax=Papaver somniferum TaxID=3469 RepID=A0A4Y7JP96_PAPSO|nr:hypothetical protein C5167_023564 [Papaver somniferum]